MTACSPSTTRNLRRNRASLEYLTVTVTADVDLDTQVVELATTKAHAQPAPGDWRTATWIGDAAHTRQAQILLDDNDLTPGTWSVFLRLTDVPEVPVLEVGTVTIT